MFWSGRPVTDTNGYSSMYRRGLRCLTILTLWIRFCYVRQMVVQIDKAIRMTTLRGVCEAPSYLESGDRSYV